MLRRLVDQVLEGMTYILLRGFFRSVEAVGLERVPRRCPLLVVANHFYGFVDPVLLVYVLGRVPRFLAKASLWRRPWVRPLLSLAGLVPVGSASRNEETGRNPAAFDFGARVLRRNGLVAVFPEGVTHDIPKLAPLRTGTARLALQAYAEGARGLVILPVGLIYDDKLALRSRALARVGEPIDLDAAVAEGVLGGGEANAENHAAVRQLMSLIERHLRVVTPDYRDARQASVLSRAAEIALRRRRGRDGVVPLADRDGLAQRLARAPADAIERLTDALGRYVLDLDILGLRDHQLVGRIGSRDLLVAVLATGFQVAVLAPLAVVGLVVNLVPFWLTQRAGRVALAPVSKGTARLLVALVVFPATWIAVAAVVARVTGRGWLIGLATVALAALCGFATVHILERMIRVRRAWRGRIALRDRRALLSEVRADRNRLVVAVEDTDAFVRASGEPS